MRMKNFIFKSSLDKDLSKIYHELGVIQKEQRANRYDNTQIIKKLDLCVKGISAIYSAPQDEESEPPATEDQD